jgi:hypothetical protein
MSMPTRPCLFEFWAFAASGQAAIAAAPPSADINSRRLIPAPRLRRGYPNGSNACFDRGRPSFATQHGMLTNAADGSKAAMAVRDDGVRFAPQSRHRSDRTGCPASANSCHMHRSKPRRYSITSSALVSRVCGIVRPSIRAVWALMTSSSLFTCKTGMSAGFVPLRIRPTYAPT